MLSYSIFTLGSAHSPMFEHLIAPDYDTPLDVDTPTLLDAQARTADFLLQMGSPEHVLDEDQKVQVRQAFAKALSPDVPTPIANASLLRLKVPEAVKHLANMLSQYDWDYVEQAKEIRGYVVAKLMEETSHPDAKIRLAALKALGSVTEVGAFTERIQVTKVDATSDELTDRIRAKLASLLPKTVEVETIEPKND